MEDNTILELADWFPVNKISWRIGQTGVKRDGKPWAKILAYLDARDVMGRLDDVLGPSNWQNQMKEIENGFACGIGVACGSTWVWKWDVAQETKVEAIKGGFSTSFKRAAVQWGIGRYLYDLGESWAECSTDKQQNQNWVGASKDKNNNPIPEFWWKVPMELDQSIAPKLNEHNRLRKQMTGILGKKFMNDNFDGKGLNDLDPSELDKAKGILAGLE